MESIRDRRDASAWELAIYRAGISIRGPAIRNREEQSLSVFWKGGELDTIFGFESKQLALD
jgi:hypothetical protein